MSKKEVVRNLSGEEQARMSVENAEINILYTTAYAIYMIAQDAERRMNASGMSFGFRRKFLFNGILKDLKGAKRKQDELHEDYIKAWGNDFKKHDEEQLNASAVARLLLLWFDRIEGYEKRENAVLKYIANTWKEDVVTKEDLKHLEIQTYDPNKE